MDKPETIADIIAEMSGGPIPQHRHDRLLLRHFADRLEAAHKRELTRVDAVIDEAVHGYPPEDIYDKRERGDCAKLREALSDACYAMFNFLKTQNGGYEEMANALDKARAALAAPPRNCDVGTAEEQDARFVEWRYSKPLRTELGLDALEWAQMPYAEKEGGAK